MFQCEATLRMSLKENFEMEMENWGKTFSEQATCPFSQPYYHGVERFSDLSGWFHLNTAWTAATFTYNRSVNVKSAFYDQMIADTICDSIPNGLWNVTVFPTKFLTWQVQCSVQSILKTLSFKPYRYAVSVCVHSKIISCSKRGKNLPKMLSYWRRGFFDDYHEIR